MVGSWGEFWLVNPSLKFNLSWNLSRNIKNVQQIFKVLKNNKIRFNKNTTNTKLGFLSDKNRLKILIVQLSDEMMQASIITVTSKVLECFGTIFKDNFIYFLFL